MKQKRVMLLAMLIIAGSLAASSQEHIFSVAAEEVRLEVLVTENGKPVLDLTAADFKVLDNGILQEIQYATPQKETPISATLVFDMSRSVAGRLLDRLKSAAYGFLADLKKEDYVALITFSNAVVLGSPLTNDIAQVKQALDQAQSFGNSSLIDATYEGLVLAESRSELPMLIIFSDGLDTFSWPTREAVLETAKRSDVVVYAISTSRLPDESFLGELVELTGGALFEVESIENPSSVFLRILNEFRQRYLLTYIPRDVSESGWHKVEVRVGNRAARVRTRPGYMRNSQANETLDKN
jgi:VWFA-related protein